MARVNFCFFMVSVPYRLNINTGASLRQKNDAQPVSGCASGFVDVARCATGIDEMNPVCVRFHDLPLEVIALQRMRTKLTVGHLYVIVHI